MNSINKKIDDPKYDYNKQGYNQVNLSVESHITKSMKIALVALLLLFIGCGFFIYSLHTEESSTAIKNFISKCKISNNINYKNISFSFAEDFKMNDLSVNFNSIPGYTFKVESVSVINTRYQAQMLSFLEMNLKHVRFSLSEIVKIINSNYNKNHDDVAEVISGINPTGDLLIHPLYILLLSGLDNVDLDLYVEYFYSPEANDLSLKLTFVENYIGELNLTVQLSHVTNAQAGRIPILLRHLLQDGNKTADIKHILGGVGVNKLEFYFKNNKLMNGFCKYYDEVYLNPPNSKSICDLSDEEKNKFEQEVANYLSISSLNKTYNKEIASELSEFVSRRTTISGNSKERKQARVPSSTNNVLRTLIDILVQLEINVRTLRRS
ncbi:MAG: hypothetical protein MJ247_07930 [Alphaproteobacteria bacterium]|nr:hypothetical protein [Alphaproteobacteria bacterium]